MEQLVTLRIIGMFSYNNCYFFFKKMNINMVNTCSSQPPCPVDLSDEGGQAHGHELQEFPRCVKLHYHGFIKRRKLPLTKSTHVYFQEKIVIGF